MLGLHIAITPPHPPPPLGEQLASTPVEVVLRQRSGPAAVKCLCWAVAILETTVILASHIPDWPCSRKIISLLAVEGSAGHIHVSPLFAVGIFLTLLGAFIRYRCYCELGKSFTFEMSIRDGHKLVQSGPYQWARHPGYTGILLIVLGFFCWNACPGSWLRECGVLHTMLGKSVVVFSSVLVTSITAGLMVRMSKEDAMLEKHFGEEWLLWSATVPYKLIPGVF
ncbi:hypothetical protein C8J57DRAFT_1431156 [Mycena rebaudengoi]|nr:hypothetical protein C8J57DRAFT_1431156 [Mycena rebaudengoi]